MIWQDAQGEPQIGAISGTLYRLVESQEQVATLGYVDTLEEQALLEEMLEGVKPPYPEQSDKLHYLLKTPFRYPPLEWGSRFGKAHEPSLFYGGGSVPTTLAESAYYRFVFWYSMEGERAKPTIRSEHALFAVDYRTQRGVRLQQAPFDQFQAQLTHPSDYGSTQTLGSAMREAELEAFEYSSARDPGKGHCVALFTPKPFRQKRPKEMNQWLCEMSATEVSFKQLAVNEISHFPLELFLFEGELTMPA